MFVAESRSKGVVVGTIIVYGQVGGRKIQYSSPFHDYNPEGGANQLVLRKLAQEGTMVLVQAEDKYSPGSTDHVSIVNRNSEPFPERQHRHRHTSSYYLGAPYTSPPIVLAQTLRQAAVTLRRQRALTDASQAGGDSFAAAVKRVRQHLQSAGYVEVR
jgi:hypothetical protein